MSKEEKELIKQGIQWHGYPVRPIGGQQAGTPIMGAHLTHPDFDFEIKCREFRSQLQSKQFCLDVFDLFLDEIR